MPEPSESERADRPGVLVLPPLLYLGALGASVVAQAVAPIRVDEGLAVRAAGVGLFVAGAVLASRARREFGRVGTNIDPGLPAMALATGGPYRFTRNPMYVALAACFVGIGLAVPLAWCLILAVPLMGVMHWGVVQREERYLEAKFGEAYREYRSRVRRYL